LKTENKIPFYETSPNPAAGADSGTSVSTDAICETAGAIGIFYIFHPMEMYIKITEKNFIFPQFCVDIFLVFLRKI